MVGLDELAPPWPDVFALMWEAYEAGTIPVGAVITDTSGRIVARGRNRIFDASADGALGNTRLAHAELNALLNLSSEQTYESWTLYSTLEPCHVCLSAAFSARVGNVRFACSDSYGGAVGKLLPSRDHVARPVLVEGPLEGIVGILPELLLVAHCLWRRPDGDVVAFYRESRPDLVETAARLPAPDSGASLTDAFESLLL